MPEGEKVITDMEEHGETYNDAINQASKAIQKFESEREIANQIKLYFDNKYGPNWHVIVGKNFSTYGTYFNKTYIFFYVGQIAVLMYRF